MNETPVVAFFTGDTAEPDTIDLPLADRVSDVIDPTGGEGFNDVLTQKILDEQPQVASDNSDCAGGMNSPVSPDKTAGQEVGDVEDETQIQDIPEIPEKATNETASKTEADEEKVEVFRELNQEKISWVDRYKVIKKQFPSVEKLDWSEVFRTDPTIMGNIINDIIKVEVAPKGRPGKRPALDRAEAEKFWSKYKKEDYTLEPFAKALNKLKGQQSIRQMARKVSMSPSYAYRLMCGHQHPTVSDMELVAQAYGKNPSYFYEYRVAYIASVMSERIEYAPESSIIYYQRLIDAKKDAR